ncbi:Basic-leucine zipper domain [Sesbania bispinosa]|nr:Basic-leucine zipper domain [Sesbania bispinosa]
MDGHSLSGGTIEKDSLSTYQNVDKLNPSPSALASDVDNFSIAIGSTNINERIDDGSQHSLFMNGSTSIIKPDVLVSASEYGSTINSKQAMSPFSIGTCIEDDLGTMGGHSLYDDTIGNDLLSTFFNMDKLNPSFAAPASTADNFAIASGTTNINERLDVGSQHSQFMNGSTSIINPDILVSTSEIGSTMNSRKAMCAFSIGTCINDDLGTMDSHSLSSGTIDEHLLSTLNMDKINPSSGALAPAADNFSIVIGTTNINERIDDGSQHSLFMNGSTSIIKPDVLVSTSEYGSAINSKQAMSPFSIGTCIDDDLGTTGGHSLYDDTIGNDLLSTFFNMDKLNPSFAAPASTADNFVVASGPTNINERLDAGSQHSQFMNGSTSIINPNILVSTSEIGSTMNSRKAMCAFSIGTCINDDLGTMDSHSLSSGTIDEHLLSTLNMDKINPSSGALAPAADNFSIVIGTTNINERIDDGSQHSLFMNGSTSIIKPDVLVSTSEYGSAINSKQAMSPFSIGTCIDDDLGTTGGHSLYDDTIGNDLLSTFFNMDKLNPSFAAPASTADNFVVASGPTNINERLDAGSQHSQFMNGSTSIINPNILVSTSEIGSTMNSRKAMSAFSIGTCINDDLGTMDSHSLSSGTIDEHLLSTLNMDKINPSSGALASAADNFSIAIATTNLNERLDVGYRDSQFMNASTSIIKPDILVSAFENGSIINSNKQCLLFLLTTLLLLVVLPISMKGLTLGSQHSQFMNGSTSMTKPDMLVSASENGSTINSRKAKSATELAELALVDPKRAKRILANRQSAIRSKEKKARYISELEKKVQTLETEKTSLSTQLTISQRDTQRKDDENNELRMGLQTLIQQLQLDDSEFMLL